MTDSDEQPPSDCPPSARQPQPAALAADAMPAPAGSWASAGSPQLTLDLPHHTAMGRDDFLVGPANRAAVDLVDQWPQWPAPAVLLVGPAGSGKSHLVNTWRERSAAIVVPARALRQALVEQLAAVRAIAIEDIDRLGSDIAVRDECERVAFHLLNLAGEQRMSILLTSRLAAGAMAPVLPDLRSRLRALAIATLDPPDDALLSGLMVKLFNDRQLKVEPSLITYLVRHMDRTMAAAHALVATIDARALASKRPVTRALAAEVLSRPTDAE